MRALVRRWSSVGLVAFVCASFSPATWGQCLRWLPENGFNSTFVVYNLTTWDRDGDGVRESLVAYNHLGLFGGSVPILGVWDGTTWSGLGEGASSNLYSMTQFDADGPGGEPPSLVIGGTWQSVYGIQSQCVARYDGTQWTAMSLPSYEAPWVLEVLDPDGPGPDTPALYAGTVSGLGTVYRWSGTGWIQVGSRLLRTGSSATIIRQLLAVDLDGSGPEPTRLVAIGNFRERVNTDGSSTPCAVAAYFDGVDWQQLGATPEVPNGFASASFANLDGNGKKLYTMSDDEFYGFSGTLRVLGGGQWLPVSFDGPAGVVLNHRLPLFRADHDNDPCTAERLFFNTQTGLAWFDGEHLAVERVGIQSEALAAVMFDPDGSGGSNPQLVFGGAFRQVEDRGLNIVRLTAAACPPVLWEVYTSVGQGTWGCGSGGYATWTNGPQLSQAEGNWRSEWGPTGCPDANSHTVVSGQWTGDMLSFSMTMMRSFGFCGWPPDIPEARTRLEIKGWVPGHRYQARNTSEVNGQIIVAQGGSTVTTRNGGAYHQDGPGTLLIDEFRDWRNEATSDTRTFDTFPGIDYSVGYYELIDEWTGYECNSVQAHIEGFARVATIAPRPAVAIHIVSQPQSTVACAGAGFPMSVGVSSIGSLTYRWEVQADDGPWVPVGGGATPLPCGGSAQAFPPDAPQTRVAITPCAGSIHRLRAVISAGCGEVASAAAVVLVNSADFDTDGDVGTDADIQAFFACLAGDCCATCGSADFNADGDIGTDADIESFFSVLSGGNC